MQTYYKLPFVDHSISHPEVPICEDVPKLARGLAELLREWLGSAVDGIFYSVQLQVPLYRLWRVYVYVQDPDGNVSRFLSCVAQ